MLNGNTFVGSRKFIFRSFKVNRKVCKNLFTFTSFMKIYEVFPTVFKILCRWLYNIRPFIHFRQMTICFLFAISGCYCYCYYSQRTFRIDRIIELTHVQSNVALVKTKTNKKKRKKSTFHGSNGQHKSINNCIVVWIPASVLTYAVVTYFLCEICT